MTAGDARRHWLRAQMTAQRVLGAIAIVLLIATGAEYTIMARDVNALVDRFSDSTWWMASQFRAEIQQLHISLAKYDGSDQALGEIREHYDIAYSRIASFEQSLLEPKPEGSFLDAFREVKGGVVAIGPAIDALHGGDIKAVQAIEEDMRPLEISAGRMTSVGAQVDAAHRGAVRVATRRANYLFAVTAVLLISSLLLSLRAVIRQASRLDIARQRSEALGRDLTVALAQAQAGARAKSAFLATMSHEVRTPMNGVLGAASLLSHTSLSERQRRWVDIVKVCGESLLAQLDDVLDFSALEAEAIRLQQEPVDLRALAERTARVMEGPAGEKGIDIVVVVDPAVPSSVISDARRLGQVLLNLLTNAVKFTQSGGVLLHISVRQRGGTAWLRASVADTGPGIPRQERQRIFEEFSRLDRPSDRAVRGTGLGLAISLRIVTALGGVLRVASASRLGLGAAGGQGPGSLFWMSVPVTLAAGAAVAPPPRTVGRAAVVGAATPIRKGLEWLLAAEGYSVVPPSNVGSEGVLDLLLWHTGDAQASRPAAAVRRVPFGPGSVLDAPITSAKLHAALTGTRSPGALSPVAIATPLTGNALRLLVADDDAINREIAASLLRHLGHHVVAVTDGPAAFAAVKAEPFDCILLDLHMPGMDGADLARAIRRLPGPARFTRLVAVTADADALVREQVLAAGIDALVTKPITLERLADALPSMDDDGPARPPASAQVVVDEASRRALAVRVTPARFAALVASFWEELMRTIAVPDRLTGSEGDRRLHSLSGSAASLGYVSVAAAARQGRITLSAEGHAFPAALAVLLERLAAASEADRTLLPPELAGRIATALATARGTGPPYERLPPSSAAFMPVAVEDAT